MRYSRVFNDIIMHSLQVTMDLELYEGRSLDCFAIGDTLRHVTEMMQFFVPTTDTSNFLYEHNAPLLHDIYIEAKGAEGQQYFIEFDPYLQIVRAVNYTVSMVNQNSTWKIRGSHDISSRQQLTINSILSIFGKKVKVFTAAHREILKLLYDGVCFVFSIKDGFNVEKDTLQKMNSLEIIRKLKSQLTCIRLIPTEESPYFTTLVNKELSIKPNIDLSLFNIVQVGLIVEENFKRVMGISLTFPAIEGNEAASDTSSVRRVYFGQSCQCVLQTLGSPESVYYQERPTTMLFLSGTHDQKHVPQQFVYNYLCLGVDIVFDAENKQVKKFIFHTNLPNHIEFNAYNRCFFKFGVTEDEYAKKGQCFLIHSGVNWKDVEKFFSNSSQKLKFLSKIYRNASTNALYPFPQSSLWLLFDQILFEITSTDNIATVYVCSVPGDKQLALQGRDRGVLVETSYEENSATISGNQTSLPLSLHDGQAHTSDVTPSLPEDEGSKQLPCQPPVRPGSSEPSSMEPLEDSDNFYSFTQDDQRGKALAEKPWQPRLPYPYPFQAYHHTKLGEMYYSSSNAVMSWSQQVTDCGTDLQCIHVEVLAEEENTLCTGAASDHVLLQSDCWRVSVYTREEKEAMEAATITAVEEELHIAQQNQQQQQDEEDFVPNTTATVSEPPALNVEYSSISSEFEEISYPIDDMSPTIDECPSDHDLNELDEHLLETAATATQENVVNDKIVSSEPPPPESSLLEGDSVDEGNNEKPQVVYKPQPSSTAASRTRGIIKNITVPPKTHLDNPSRRKKPNSELAKNPNNVSSSPQNEKHNRISPKTSAKSNKNSTAAKVDRRKVHFYTDEKSKAIASSFKPKEKIEIVKRAHKDGTGYPHHHFKSSQLSALLQHDNVTSVPNHRSSTNVPSTFNRIFAAETGQEDMKPQPVVKKLNTPFATEHNSSVFTDQSDSPSQEEFTSQGELLNEVSNSPVDDRVNSVVAESDQTANHDDQEDQSNKGVCGGQAGDISDQTDDQDSETGDHDSGQGSHTSDKDNQTEEDSQISGRDSQTEDQDHQTGDLAIPAVAQDNDDGTITPDRQHVMSSQDDQSLHQNQALNTQIQNDQAASYADNDEDNRRHKSLSLSSKELPVIDDSCIAETVSESSADQQETVSLSTMLTNSINDCQPSSMDRTTPDIFTSSEEKLPTSTEPSDNSPNLLESTQTKSNDSHSNNTMINHTHAEGDTLTNNDDDTPVSSAPLQDSNEADELLRHHSFDDNEGQQPMSPRKQWSMDQLESCPDSLNQV